MRCVMARCRWCGAPAGSPTPLSTPMPSPWPKATRPVSCLTPRARPRCSRRRAARWRFMPITRAGGGSCGRRWPRISAGMPRRGSTKRSMPACGPAVLRRGAAAWPDYCWFYSGVPRGARDRGQPVGRLTHVVEDRAHHPVLQAPVDLRYQPAPLLLIAFGGLLVDQLVELAIAAMGVVAVRIANIVLVEILVGVVEAAADESLCHAEVAAR